MRRTNEASNGRFMRYTAAPCGCKLAPSQFLQMIETYAHRMGSDVGWKEPRRLVQPYHWTCAAPGLQDALLQSDDRTSLPAWLAPAAQRSESSMPAVRREPARILTGRGVDKALLNGKIFTSDARGFWCDAIAIHDGYVAAVGSVKEIQALCGPRTEVFHLDGRVVIPGFNDAHMHHTPDPSGVRLPIDPVADPLQRVAGREVRMRQPQLRQVGQGRRVVPHAVLESAGSFQ